MTTTKANQIQATQVRKTGLGVGGRIHWESNISETEITMSEAQAAQATAGYHEMGYGFFSFHCQKVDGGYKATWTCSASCD